MKNLLALVFLCLLAGCGAGDDAGGNEPAPVAALPPPQAPPAVPLTGIGAANDAPHLTPLVAWAGVPDWETFQGNAGHTGHVPVTLDVARFSLRWRWEAPATGTPDQAISTVVAGNGRVFAAVGTRLYARSEVDGSGIWSHEFGAAAGPAANPPALSNGVVYIVAGHGGATSLFGFQASSGALQFDSPMESQFESWLAPTVAVGKVFTGGGRFGGLYAFDPITGRQLWFVGRPQTDLWTPAVDGERVYTYTDVLTVANATDGTQAIGSIPGTSFPYTGAPVRSAPVAGPPGSVFALNGDAADNALLHFDVANGRLAWAVNGQYRGNPAYANERMYALAGIPPALEVRARADATLLWEWRPPGPGDSAFVGDVLLTDNLVFVSTTAATYAIDLATRRTAWRFPQPGRLALSANGVLYIAHGAGLTAVNVK